MICKMYGEIICKISGQIPKKVRMVFSPVSFVIRAERMRAVVTLLSMTLKILYLNTVIILS